MTKKNSFGRTKIIGTIGPASSSVESLVSLIQAGMDVVRLNFSHGTYTNHQTVIENVKRASAMTGEHITVMQDLSGPKIRTGVLKNGSVVLKEGDLIRFTIEEIEGTKERVSTTYKNLPRDVQPENIILLDDGKLRVRVVETSPTEVACKVEVGGTLSNHKGMNLPGVRLSTQSFTRKDIEDLAFGLLRDIDYVALSFVRTAEDIRMLREEIVKLQPRADRIPVVAKIEMGEAVRNIDAIIQEADAVMVARGDLGVELPTEDVPMIQKSIARSCNEAGKPVIIATQMLESMIESPRPTRAEANDVANAVLDGADAVMLSGETSIGKFPFDAVQTMDNIIRRVEQQVIHPPDRIHKSASGGATIADAVAHAACVLAHQVNACAIVPITHSGATAIMMSKYRPQESIIAVTGNEKVLRKLNVVWGVRGILLPDYASAIDEALTRIKGELKRQGYVQQNDYVVFVAGIPLLARGATDSIKVERIQ